MKIYKIIFFIAFIFILSMYSSAQDKNQDKEMQISKHSLNIELFGKGLYFGNFSYEYAFKRNLVFGTGIGFQAQHNNFYDLQNNKSVKELFLTVPLYMVFKTHKDKRHHIVFTLGITPLLSVKHSGYSAYKSSHYNHETSRFDMVRMFPSFAIGYEANFGTFYFRFSIYIQYLGENYWYTTVIPWAGITIGRHFLQKKK